MTSRPASVSPAPTPLDAFLPRPDFAELHRRRVPAPAEAVWAAATSVTPAEIRLLRPLMTLRTLPRALAGGRLQPRTPDDAPFLDVFEEEGFVELRHDDRVIDGAAVVVYGAAGRFWSPAGNAPVPLAGPQAFEEHRAPGTVRIAFSLEVVERDGATFVTTETRIVGADPGARRAFGRYWLIIRGPSGLIRRSWLAAIDRRSRT